MNRSPGPIFSSAGTHNPMTSTSAQRSLHDVVEPLAEQRAGAVHAGGVDDDELAVARCARCRGWRAGWSAASRT